MGPFFETSNALRGLRSSRSAPPGLASDDGPRQATYSASLQQFEELLASAQHVGPASKPLLLFYALSQAGRAVVAARKPGEFRLKGHGLRQGGAVPENLLAFPIEVTPRRDGMDSFGAVRGVLSDGVAPDVLQIGSAWAALPGMYMIPKFAWEPDWRPAIDFDARTTGSRFGGRLLGVASNPHVPFDDVLPDLAKSYPSLPPTTAGAMVAASRELGEGSWMADLEWPADAADLDEVVPVGEHGHRWLLPAIAPGSIQQPRLALWWVLLFGLSLIARYEPDAWARALDLEGSRLAVPLETVLESAEKAVPQLVHYEVFRE